MRPRRRATRNLKPRELLKRHLAFGPHRGPARRSWQPTVLGHGVLAVFDPIWREFKLFRMGAGRPIPLY